LIEEFVFLDGLRGGKAVKGWFRNLRVWEMQPDGRWRCVFWFNKPFSSEMRPRHARRVME
jgi:hypothetical protein